MLTVVTGATGHLGANLIPALLAEGRRVRVLVLPGDPSRALDGLEIERVEGDVRDADALRHAFDGADIVYHLAGYISIQPNAWPIVEAVNIHGVRNVVETCLQCGVRRLVHFSSIHAFVQEPLEEPLDETRPLVSLNSSYPEYDRSKAAGEREIQKGIKRGLDAVILNPTGMMGPNDYGPSHFGAVLLALASGKFPVWVESGFDWVDVRDVAACALRAEASAAPGAKYLLSGHWISAREMTASISEITGAPAPRCFIPIALACLFAPLGSIYARLTKRRALFTPSALHALAHSNRKISRARAAQDLGYRPRPFYETLVDTFRWFEESGALSD